MMQLFIEKEIDKYMFSRITLNLRTHIKALQIFICAALLSSATITMAGQSLEIDFMDLYVQIIRAVDAGKLDKKVGKEARTLDFELQKEIITLDNKIDKLKSTPMGSSSAQRDKTFDELIAIGAQKERVYGDYLRRLEVLAGTGDRPAALGITPVKKKNGGPVSEKILYEGDVVGGDSSAPEKRALTIEMTPEDISTGDFD